MHRTGKSIALSALAIALGSAALGLQGCTAGTAPGSGSSSSSSSSAGGSSTSSSGGSSSSSSSTSTSSTSTSSSSSSSGSTDGGNEAAATTLNQRLGGKAGIAAAVDAIVAEELKDADTASFFYYQVTNKPDGGAPPARDMSPTVAQLKDCLVVQLDEASGGNSQYAGYVSNGHACRTMKAAHTGLKISAKAFDKFVTVAAGVLKSAGVADADIAVIGGVLNATKSDVVDPVNGADKFTPPN